jgi:Xaa-Pro aminopeptidase
MRVLKSPAEIELMRKAAQISAHAHRTLMTHCRVNQKEYELEALFQYQCMQAGARALAYPSIIAGGSNACILHYIKNDETLKDGDLVLVDAGAEYQNYASDITRTFPVNGQFNAFQKALYQVVLKAQCAAIELLKPGLIWEQLQGVMVEILTEGLLELGILKGNLKKLIAEKAYQKFYMHSSGHWLGLDVHDVGSYASEQCSQKLSARGTRILEAGMVLTIEPGIYIPKGACDVPEQWRGIGIRIEDDILVTPTGYEVLSAGIPKTVEEIEDLMHAKKRL